MMTLVVPAFNAIRGGTDFTSEVFDISGMLEEARAYAMSNNTFVLVGIAETSGTLGTAASPQVSGTGRIAIAIIASKDGTRPYQSLLNTGNLTNWQTVYGTGGAFTAVAALTTFSNIHMVDLQNGALQLPTTGNMARAAVPSDQLRYPKRTPPSPRPPSPGRWGKCSPTRRNIPLTRSSSTIRKAPPALSRRRIRLTSRIASRSAFNPPTAR